MKKIVELEGVGPKTSLLFEKLGIYNIEDLVTYYPKRYDILKRTDMNNVEDKDRVVIDGIVEGRPTIVQVSSNLKKIMFRISNNVGIYNIAVYNQVYLMRELRVGLNVIVLGKYDRFKNTVNASEVRIGILPSIPKIEPIYGATEGLNRKVISKVIDTALNSDIEIIDHIPEEFVIKYKFPSKLWAIEEMHHPSSGYNYKRARQRLKYEEFFWYLYRIRELKYSNSGKTVEGKNFDENKVKEFIKGLSFELTKDQVSTIDEIRKDMQSTREMNRLVQGDVGSGKTIVAFIAAYMNYLAGYQTALMVPTEILAEQHYQGALDLFKNTDMEIALLTSSLTKRKREAILKRLGNGEIDFIVGTQSLIQKEVVYKRLGLIIADEQHRFGVNQRKLLKEKGILPDVLSMSATPIPRTYALTIYGDMDVSSIKTMPNGRKEIITILKSNSEIKNVLELMYQEIKNKHQIYVIAPLIEESDKIDLENINKLEEKMTSAFGKICKLGVMHGKMEKTEKDKVMESFKNGDISILISTTVIEVGVDVKNATMIVIFDAYRFGLSQLHQLRGRVGRNDLQSYCVLISDKEAERLNIMTKTTDGFKISEEDFKLRGSGDIFGVRQSGDMSFKLADFKTDFNILLKAKEDSLKLLESGKINEYKKLKNILNQSINLD